MERKQDRIFSAKIEEGHVPKVIFDSLATNMQRIPLHISSRGIRICVGDKEPEPIHKSHIMWDMFWERKKFVEYVCKKKGTISVSVTHLHKLLKSVKKKNSLLFYIDKSDINILYITIQPTGAQKGEEQLSETVRVSIQWLEDSKPIVMPSTYFDEDKIEHEAYGDPMVIKSINFQKIKKLTGVCKNSISVIIQRDNYVSFRASHDKVMGLDLEIGALTTSPEVIISSSEDDESKESPSEDDEEEESPNGEEESQSVDEEESQSVDEESEDEAALTIANEADPFSIYPDVYKREFNVSLLSSLVKLPGLCKQMEFYAPKVPHFPMKVSLTASSGLTEIFIFIKDKSQIDVIDNAKAMDNHLGYGKK